jgi:hypothetical protein
MLLPWARGPGEILQHGLALLHKGSAVHRRLALICIDNSVELMVKTFLGLPKRITGLDIARNLRESLPRLLELLAEHAADKLVGVDLGLIEWYHRLRNELYHQGNGLSIERDKVAGYAEQARLLFQNLFGFLLPESPLRPIMPPRRHGRPSFLLKGFLPWPGKNRPELKKRNPPGSYQRGPRPPKEMPRCCMRKFISERKSAI